MILQALVKTENSVEMENIDINLNKIINLEDLSRFLSFKKRFNGNFKFFCDNKEFEKSENINNLDFTKILFCEGKQKEKKILKINNYYKKCAITQIYRRGENTNFEEKNLLEKRKKFLEEEIPKSIKKLKTEINEKKIAGIKKDINLENLIKKKEVLKNNLKNITKKYEKFKSQNLENTKEYFQTEKKKINLEEKEIKNLEEKEIKNLEEKEIKNLEEKEIKLDIEKFKKMDLEEKNENLKNRIIIYRLIKFDNEGLPAITENKKGEVISISQKKFLIKNEKNEENYILLNNIYSILIKSNNLETKKNYEIEKTTKENSIRIQKQNSDNLLKLEVSKQISYYFSDKNYYKDKYINREIENDRDHGFRIKLFLTFNRIKNFGIDFRDLKQALVDFESNPDCNYVFITENKIVKKNLR